MKTKTFVLIGNPHAGRGRAAITSEAVAAALGATGASIERELTTSGGHARELAERTARAGDIAVAVGGDGVLRAVAAGASTHGGTVGIVPCGRGNDFARTVGITSVELAVEVLIDGVPRPTDCIAVRPGCHPWFPDLAGGDVDGRHSEISDLCGDIALGNVYAGFDSLSNGRANELTTNLGPFAYSYTALRVALSMAPLHFEIVCDGVFTEFTGSGVIIANSSHYGRGVRVAPTADVHDGLLDVLTFGQTTRVSRIATLLALRKGRHCAREGVRHLRARHVQLFVEPAIEAYSDGDPVSWTPLTAQVMPGAINLLRLWSHEHRK